jgi:hypothetical protein
MKDKLPLECGKCKNTFYKTKHRILQCKKESILGKNKNGGTYCSHTCFTNSSIKRLMIECKQCKKMVSKTPYEIGESKNLFCSRSCSCTYHNSHKKYGTRRSKLEKWLEIKLSELHSNLQIDYNKTNTINAELDIYIPSLKLAFELNGIFHYEPIFSKEKLEKTKNNDQRKFQACLEHGISLCVIDTSSQKYFKESTSQKYLDIILNILKTRM